MNIKLDAQEVIFAIEVYLAIKGLKSDDEYVKFNTNKNRLDSVELKNIRPAKFNIDKLIENVRN